MYNPPLLRNEMKILDRGTEGEGFVIPSISFFESLKNSLLLSFLIEILDTAHVSLEESKDNLIYTWYIG